MDLVTQFHQQTWDNVHFYLVHLFQVGMRQKQQEYNEEKKEDIDDDDEWKCFDEQFKKQTKIIQTKRKKFPRFSGRFQPTSNKVTVATMPNEGKNEESNVEGMVRVIPV